MTSFHIRHDLSPVLAQEALLLLRSGPAANVEALLKRARMHDFELGRRQSLDKVSASLRDLGLVARQNVPSGSAIALTPLGSQMADLALRDELLLCELIHLRYSWLWAPEHGGENFSWAYQTVAAILWEEAPIRIDSDRLVATVLASAERQLGIKSISFSPSSVLGIMHWLRALSPPCVVGNQFRRRPACSSEAIFLALEGIQSVRGHRCDTPLRLDGPTRTRVCRTLLLDEGSLDDMLTQAEETLGLVRRNGDGGPLVLLRRSLFPGLVSECGHAMEIR